MLRVRSKLDGSAVITDLNGKQYIVTANHLIQDALQPDFWIFQHNIWKKIIVKVLARDEQYDVIILCASVYFERQSLPIEFNLGHIVLGSQFFFLVTHMGSLAKIRYLVMG